MTDLLPEGFRDRLAPQSEALSTLARAVLDCFRSHGYARVTPPLAEYDSVLARRSRAGAARNWLRFTDPMSQRTLAIRSDMTVQVARIAGQRLVDAPRPLRLSYHGPVLKLRASQLRPDREMTQLGAELVGSDSVAAACEIVAIAVEALTAAGVEGITVDLTLPDLVETLASEALPLPPERVEAVRAELDMKDAGALRAMGAEAYLPLIGVTGPFARAIERLAAVDAAGALDSRIAALRDIAAAVPEAARVTLDPTERHGFEYQSWFGFTLFAEGHVGALGRGGTYRIARADGRHEAATGVSLYPDPLIDARAPADAERLLFLPLGHDRDTARRLRAEGWRTVAALSADDDPRALDCSHVLAGKQPVAV